MARRVKGVTKQTGKGRNPNDYFVNTFPGLVTAVKDQKQLTRGTAIDELNWITGTYNDNIQLRQGTARLGKTAVAGSGKVTGIGVGVRNDGYQVPFFTYARKLKYYDKNQDDTFESGNNLLPATASGEDVSIEPYSNLAGAFVYLSSRHSSIYKVAVANPGSPVDQQSQTYKGLIRIKQNRTFLWQDLIASTGASDLTGLYLSYIDRTLYSQYTQTANENYGVGNGATKTFNHTLQSIVGAKTAFLVQVMAPVGAAASISAITKAVNAQITANGHGFTAGQNVMIENVAGMTQINNQIVQVVSVIDANNFTINLDTTGYTTYTSGGSVAVAEQFYDDKNGNLTSPQGGTGTVNYATGAVSVTFNTAPSNTLNILTSYYFEDATMQGICDFRSSSPRTAGQGNYFPQFDGAGLLQNVFSFGQDEYCFHQFKTWILTLTGNDTQATNLIYRDKVGIPYWRGAYGTADGIPYVDCLDQGNPRFRILTYSELAASTAVIPKSLSDTLDLSMYAFDFPVVYEWGNYYILCCQALVNGVKQNFNGVTLIYNKLSKAWDKLDYNVSCLATFYGALIAGDPLSNNVYTLFSGNDDDGQVINNFWNSDVHDLDIDGTKKFYRFVVDGYIASSQKLQIAFSYDYGAYTPLTTVIKGTDTYVDKGNGILVGSDTMGNQIVGATATANAYHFRREFLVASDKFEYVSVQFKALDVGGLQINEYGFVDVRAKGRKVSPQYYG